MITRQKTKSFVRHGQRRRRPYGRRHQRATQAKLGVLRIIPLGGMEEVGRNMTIFEYENDIVILDMGLQFPEEEMH